MRRPPENRMIASDALTNRADDPPLVGLADGYAISAGEFEGWLGAARGPREIIYAQGYRLPRGATAVIIASEWERAGLVTLTSRVAMSADNGGNVARWWHFIAQRRGGNVVPAQSGDTGVLHFLRRCAGDGQPGPTHDEIARACGLNDKEQARYQLRKLVAAGLVQIEDRGPRQRRVFRVRMDDGSMAATRGGAL